MSRLWLLGGTVEGRELAGALSASAIPVVLTVATDYGKELVPPLPGVEVRAGRLDREEMVRLIGREGIGAVIDATHPYAAEVTQNARAAAVRAGVPYIRCVRPAAVSPCSDNIVTVRDYAAAVSYLAEREGNVFVATGSKELRQFLRLEHYQERLYARVLPVPEVISACLELGIKGTHLMAMQGPFSAELNKAMFKMAGARFLVTKDGGKAGGLEEKLAAAVDLGMEVILIQRPEEKGCDLDQAMAFACAQMKK